MAPEIHIFHLELNSFLLLYAIAVVVATFLLQHELKINHYPPYLFATLILVGFISGLIGSKAYHLLFEVWDEFLLSPFEVSFNISGYGWYGGFILAGISIALTLRIKNLPVLKTLDVIAPIIPISQVFGRFGCFLAGCCQGTPSNLPWAVSFPNGLFPESVGVHPTQLYEMFAYVGISTCLWKLRKKEMPNGAKFSLYLILAGLERLIFEFYRLNPRVLFQLTVPQIIAILTIGLGLFIFINSRHEDAPWRKMG